MDRRVNLKKGATMGAWDVGIFDNDMVLDVRDAFEDALASGSDVAAATEMVLQGFADALDDADDGPAIYLVLAALQLEQGTVDPTIRALALDSISSEQDAQRWNADVVEQQQQVVDDLWRRLSES